MKFIKIAIRAVASFIIACLLFEASPLAVIFIFCGLNCITFTSKDNCMIPRKSKWYGIACGACICGVILIALGKWVLKSDGVIILGALMFSTTFTPILIREIIALINFLLKRKC